MDREQSESKINSVDVIIERSNKFYKAILSQNLQQKESNIDQLDNRIEKLKNEGVDPNTILEFANNVQPLIHPNILMLIDDFIENKRQNGSNKEREFYENFCQKHLELEERRKQFITRLLQKRPVTAYQDMPNVEDYLLADGTKDQSGSKNPLFEKIGTDFEVEPFILENYISRDEMKISAMISVAAPSFFINDGNRENKGIRDPDKNNYAQTGDLIGAVGARLEMPEIMEGQDLLIQKKFHTPANGYGAERNLNAAKRLEPFAKFYHQKQDKNGFYFPSYEEVKKDFQEKGKKSQYIPLKDGNFINKEVYIKRIRVVLEMGFERAVRRAALQDKKASIYLAGLGLGNWAVGYQDTLGAIQLELVGELLSSRKYFSQISTLHFGYFPNGEKSKVTFTALFDNPLIQWQQKISYSYFDSETQSQVAHDSRQVIRERTSPVGEDEYLTAFYAWDYFSFPGNEFWVDEKSLSDDPAAICCSTNGELQNPVINPENVNGHKAYFGALHSVKEKTKDLDSFSFFEKWRDGEFYSEDPKSIVDEFVNKLDTIRGKKNRWSRDFPEDQLLDLIWFTTFLKRNSTKELNYDFDFRNFVQDINSRTEEIIKEREKKIKESCNEKMAAIRKIFPQRQLSLLNTIFEELLLNQDTFEKNLELPYLRNFFTFSFHSFKVKRTTEEYQVFAFRLFNLSLQSLTAVPQSLTEKNIKKLIVLVRFIVLFYKDIDALDDKDILVLYAILKNNLENSQASFDTILNTYYKNIIDSQSDVYPHLAETIPTLDNLVTRMDDFKGGIDWFFGTNDSVIIQIQKIKPKAEKKDSDTTDNHQVHNPSKIVREKLNQSIFLYVHKDANPCFFDSYPPEYNYYFSILADKNEEENVNEFLRYYNIRHTKGISSQEDKILVFIAPEEKDKIYKELGVPIAQIHHDEKLIESWELEKKELEKKRNNPSSEIVTDSKKLEFPKPVMPSLFNWISDEAAANAFKKGPMRFFDHSPAITLEDEKLYFGETALSFINDANSAFKQFKLPLTENVIKNFITVYDALIQEITAQSDTIDAILAKNNVPEDERAAVKKNIIESYPFKVRSYYSKKSNSEDSEDSEENKNLKAIFMIFAGLYVSPKNAEHKNDPKKMFEVVIGGDKGPKRALDDLIKNSGAKIVIKKIDELIGNILDFPAYKYMLEKKLSHEIISEALEEVIKDLPNLTVSHKGQKTKHTPEQIIGIFNDFRNDIQKNRQKYTTEQIELANVFFDVVGIKPVVEQKAKEGSWFEKIARKAPDKSTQSKKEKREKNIEKYRADAEGSRTIKRRKKIVSQKEVRIHQKLHVKAVAPQRHVDKENSRAFRENASLNLLRNLKKTIKEKKWKMPQKDNAFFELFLDEKKHIMRYENNDEYTVPTNVKKMLVEMSNLSQQKRANKNVDKDIRSIRSLGSIVKMAVKASHEWIHPGRSEDTSEFYANLLKDNLCINFVKSIDAIHAYITHATSQNKWKTKIWDLPRHVKDILDVIHRNGKYKKSTWTDEKRLIEILDIAIKAGKKINPGRSDFTHGFYEDITDFLVIDVEKYDQQQQARIQEEARRHEVENLQPRVSSTTVISDPAKAKRASTSKVVNPGSPSSVSGRFNLWTNKASNRQESNLDEEVKQKKTKLLVLSFQSLFTKLFDTFFDQEATYMINENIVNILKRYSENGFNIVIADTERERANPIYRALFQPTCSVSQYINAFQPKVMLTNATVLDNVNSYCRDFDITDKNDVYVINHSKSDVDAVNDANYNNSYQLTKDNSCEKILTDLENSMRTSHEFRR